MHLISTITTQNQNNTTLARTSRRSKQQQPASVLSRSDIRRLVGEMIG